MAMASLKSWASLGEKIARSYKILMRTVGVGLGVIGRHQSELSGHQINVAVKVGSLGGTIAVS